MVFTKSLVFVPDGPAQVARRRTVAAARHARPAAHLAPHALLGKHLL